MERLYTVKEVAEALRVTTDFVLDHAQWAGHPANAQPPLQALLIEDSVIKFRAHSVSTFLDKWVPQEVEAARIRAHADMCANTHWGYDN